MRERSGVPKASSHVRVAHLWSLLSRYGVVWDDGLTQRWALKQDHCHPAPLWVTTSLQALIPRRTPMPRLFLKRSLQACWACMFGSCCGLLECGVVRIEAGGSFVPPRSVFFPFFCYKTIQKYGAPWSEIAANCCEMVRLVETPGNLPKGTLSKIVGHRVLVRIGWWLVSKWCELDNIPMVLFVSYRVYTC